MVRPNKRWDSVRLTPTGTPEPYYKQTNKFIKCPLKNIHLKLRLYEKATKFEKISHLFWHHIFFYSVESKQVGDFKTFCGLLRKAELYDVWRFFFLFWPTYLPSAFDFVAFSNLKSDIMYGCSLGVNLQKVEKLLYKGILFIAMDTINNQNCLNFCWKCKIIFFQHFF